MNALPIWDAEQRLEAAPVLSPIPSHPTPSDPTPSDPAAATLAAVPDEPTAAPEGAGAPTATPEPVVVPGGPRGAALVEAITALEPGTSVADAVERLLHAIDSADAEAGYARVDTTDAVLQQRIARLVSGASLPSRGTGTQARDILSLLRGHRPA